MNAVKIIISRDGEEYTHGLYVEEIAAKIVASINNSPAGKAGLVARIGETLDVHIIEQETADRFETDFSTHRLARRAIEAARKARCRAYAIHGDKRVEIVEILGNVNGRRCYQCSRYLIEGQEYELWCGGKFDLAETRTKAGALIAYYRAVVAR